MKLKKIFFLILFFFQLTAINAEEKIAFIDLELVLKTTNFGKSSLDNINKLNNENLEKLENKKKELDLLETTINKKKNIISKEELDKEIVIFRDKVKNFKIKQSELQKDFNNFKKIKLNDFFNRINPIIQEYMDSNSIDILLDRKYVFIGKTNSDITNEIIKKINKEIE